MNIEQTNILDVYVLTPTVLKDSRGFFMEAYNHDRFKKQGLQAAFMQLNQSRSVKNVIRGLHFQYDPPMAKLMRVIQGTAFLVAVDIRKGSSTFGKWIGIEASQENKKQLLAPAGCARGFCVLSDAAEIEYLCTGTYNAKCESGIIWNDPEIAVEWPVTDPIISEKDKTAQSFREWCSTKESNLFV